MNTPNKNDKPTDNMELLKQQAADCGPGCACNATGTPGKTRWVIGAIVLIAAGVLVVRAMIKSDGAATQATVPAFAALTTAPASAGDSATVTNAVAAAPANETSVGTSIGALAELNTVAAKTDAVFIFLPGKDGAAGNPPSALMKGAASMIESKAGLKCGLFTLKAGSRDYDQIAAQISVPGVLAMVKGRGMSAVSGEITEAKLVQGFVAASSGAAAAVVVLRLQPGAARSDTTSEVIHEKPESSTAGPDRDGHGVKGIGRRGSGQEVLALRLPA